MRKRAKAKTQTRPRVEARKHMVAYAATSVLDGFTNCKEEKPYVLIRDVERDTVLWAHDYLKSGDISTNIHIGNAIDSVLDSNRKRTGFWVSVVDVLRAKSFQRGIIPPKPGSKKDSDFWARFRSIFIDSEGTKERWVVSRVNSRIFDAKEHWGDPEWMNEHRNLFLPSPIYPTSAIVAADFHLEVVGAANERHARAGEGLIERLSHRVMVLSMIDNMSDESKKAVARTIIEAELLSAKLAGDAVYEAELSRLRIMR